MICEAIASVVNIDVTIVDRNLIRIGGTGRYKDSLGSVVSIKSAFSYALSEGLGFVIENPGTHQACLECDCKDKCNEHAEMCCPILSDGEVVGVIGLIAFKPSQRRSLIDNQDNLMAFLGRMADLIASKLKEQERIDATEMLAKELEVVIDSMDTGFLAVDTTGQTVRLNRKAKMMLGTVNVKTIQDVFMKQEVERILHARDNIKNHFFKFPSGQTGVYDSALIKIGNQIKGHVITIKPLEEIINTLNDVTLDVVTTEFSDIIGHSQAIRQVKTAAQKVSRSKSTVLILGESGTGKELFARAVHNASKRSEAPFIALNCAAIPDSLLESELFGYEEGAFTGAKRGGKPGKFQLANRGTLFLDEIGDMPLHLQTKLLRVIQESKVEPIGGSHSIDIDVRIIAATHQDLEEKVLEGSFRQDLYYRLNVIPIIVPPLRHRMEDLKALIDSILNKCNGKLEKKVESIDKDCYDWMMRYDWPGNIRELENALEYAVNMCEGDIIETHHLPRKLTQQSDPPIAHGNISSRPIKTLESIEREMIQSALHHYGEDRSAVEKASNALGISRATLYRKIKLYGLD
jgi:transcriptional regulator with PAS, ATPase and Fis domain